ncbi:MAG TPA: winged helix-turn-helix domain-containing protein [Gaiellales bacterium]|nr:winged helix-turn-helix domain-containing protein [Gaiellales bacterium]
MIDTLRREIQDRLDQLLAEAEKLRKALAALDPRGHQPPPRKAQPGRRTPVPPPAKPRRRAEPGSTKSRVLAALSDGQPMTAGEVAAVTGLARPTVSTTLTRLAKNGEARRAERGYTLPTSAGGDHAAGSERPSPASQ